MDAVAIDKRNVGIRVNFDIEKMCPGQSQCADEGGRFGFCYENKEFHKAVEKIEQKKPIYVEYIFILVQSQEGWIFTKLFRKWHVWFKKSLVLNWNMWI